MVVAVRNRSFKQGKSFLDIRNAWQVQREPNNDTRALFKRYVTRKPIDWDDIKALHFKAFDKPTQDALINKPVVEMSLDEVLQTFTVTVPTEFILHNIKNGRNYYVNTEGYAYAKYIFEILALPIEVIEQSRN